MTRSIDIYPTVAGLSGVAIPSGKEPDGVDLSEALRAGDTPQLRAFSHTALLPSAYLDQIKRCPKLIEFFGSRLPEAKWVAMRSGDELFKWAKFSRQAPEFKPAVFNLKQDPHAWSNLYDGSNELHRVGIQRVKDFKLKVTDAFNRALLKQRKEIPQSEKERRLRALGYIE